MYDGENIWVANGGDTTVTKLAQDGAQLGNFTVGTGPFALAFDGESIWVANSGVDPLNEEVQPGTVTKLAMDGIVLGTFPVGKAPVSLASDGQGIVVSNLGDATVMKLGLDGRLLAQVELETQAGPLAMVQGDIWVLSQPDNTVTVLSPSLDVLTTYPTGPQPYALVFDGEAVWMTNVGDATVTKMGVDGTVLGNFEVEQPFSLAFDGRSVWVGGVFGGGLTRLSLEGTTLQRLPTVGDPFDLAWDGEALWVTSPKADQVSRLVFRDAPGLGLPLTLVQEELAPPNADLSRYLLSQEEIARVPGEVAWTELESAELVSDTDFTYLFTPGEGEYDTNVAESIEASGEAQAAAEPITSLAFQSIFQLETQLEAIQLMERLRSLDYPLVGLGGFGITDDEVWLQELDPLLFGPEAFAVETHGVVSARIEKELGFGGPSIDAFHGWKRWSRLSEQRCPV